MYSFDCKGIQQMSKAIWRCLGGGTLGKSWQHKEIVKACAIEYEDAKADHKLWPKCPECSQMMRPAKVVVGAAIPMRAFDTCLTHNINWWVDEHGFTCPKCKSEGLDA